MKPLYIFDLDGTLALIDHRRHLVEQRACTDCDGCGTYYPPPEPVTPPVGAKYAMILPPSEPCRVCNGKGELKPDWPAFYKACVHDRPNAPVISILETLARARCDVWIWSGRSAEVMNETLSWLHKHLSEHLDFDKLQLCMRREGDFTPDDVLKAGWYDDLHHVDRERLVAIFDDRDKVVRMWRSKGVACFQVAPGDF